MMPYSMKANKVTTLELDINELRSFLAEKAHDILGQVESGFERKIEMEPLFNVEHGEAALTGIRVVVTDTLNSNSGRIHSINSATR